MIEWSELFEYLSFLVVVASGIIMEACFFAHKLAAIRERKEALDKFSSLESFRCHCDKRETWMLNFNSDKESVSMYLFFANKNNWRFSALILPICYDSFESENIANSWEPWRPVWITSFLNGIHYSCTYAYMVQRL